MFEGGTSAGPKTLKSHKPIPAPGDDRAKACTRTYRALRAVKAFVCGPAVLIVTSAAGVKLVPSMDVAVSKLA